MTVLPAPPRDPALVPPPRAPGSVRRTSTLLMTWPDGLGTQLRLDGRCRDLLTPVEGPPVTLAQAEVEVGAALDRTIESIATNPPVPAAQGLVGARGGGKLRAAIDAHVPEQRAAGTPLHLLLDDLAGATLISGFVMLRWRPPSGEMKVARRNRMRSMEGICTGFRSGSSALNADGSHSAVVHNVAAVAPLVDPSDPEGWHELHSSPPLAMRRARRIDVRTTDKTLEIDAMFRDSCWDPDGSEIAVHEYDLAATADRATGTLTSVVAEPRVLPFAECPTAAANASWMVGAPLQEMRTEVLDRLRSTDCCTHLNDALRSLAEVPVLAAHIPTAGAS